MSVPIFEAVVGKCNEFDPRGQIYSESTSSVGGMQPLWLEPDHWPLEITLPRIYRHLSGPRRKHDELSPGLATDRNHGLPCDSLAALRPVRWTDPFASLRLAALSCAPRTTLEERTMQHCMFVLRSDCTSAIRLELDARSCRRYSGMARTGFAGSCRAIAHLSSTKAPSPLLANGPAPF